jgi:uroporphyrin-III C-methyltransferase/precorrin-2 dehydrogenase/sirohydrochlorin ferrochelatase
MRHFPIFLNLHGATALVIGTGDAADRRAASFAEAGSKLRRATHFTPELLDGCAIAAGAGALESDLVALSNAAQARGIPVNIVDRPEYCSYLTPSIIDRDPLTIAVCSGGTAPLLARLLRSRIEAWIPPRYGTLAQLAGQFATQLRAALPDVRARRRLLERVLGGRVADLCLAGETDAAQAEFSAEIAAAEASEHQRTPAGIVHLVGGGPGAADLLTIRAQRLLGEADIIVHDRLVSDEVLAMARRDTPRIYVGKEREHHCLRQEDINALLIDLAQKGNKVVRLKGGDPFIFGRGGEEAEALANAGIAHEVVPGITAALACAAGARIPLTHREATRAVTFVTGHTKEHMLNLEFAALVQSRATLAVYMGIASLPTLRRELLAHGMPASTPAALIERGGTVDQRNLIGTLEDILEISAGWTTRAPTMVLIGDAVGRRG